MIPEAIQAACTACSIPVKDGGWYPSMPPAGKPYAELDDIERIEFDDGCELYTSFHSVTLRLYTLDPATTRVTLRDALFELSTELAGVSAGALSATPELKAADWTPILARDLEETEPMRNVLSKIGTVTEMLLNRRDTMLAGNLIMNEYMPAVMERVAADRWINAKNVGAKILVTESPAEYALLAKTKPAGIDLLTLEEAIAKCL